MQEQGAERLVAGGLSMGVDESRGSRVVNHVSPAQWVVEHGVDAALTRGVKITAIKQLLKDGLAVPDFTTLDIARKNGDSRSWPT